MEATTPSSGAVDYLDGESNFTLPDELTRLSVSGWAQIVLASVVFVLGLYGNYHMFLSLKDVYEHKYSSMHHMLSYVCYTEFLFILIVIPLDIAWRSSIGWYAGELECKIANFSRCFIWFLSSLVLISMSVDCCYSVFHPKGSGYLGKSGPKRRVKILIFSAFSIAFVSATPKFYLSYVKQLPVPMDSFQQCVMHDAPEFFSIYPLIESYFAPLVFIMVCYIPTFFKICQQLAAYPSDPTELEESNSSKEKVAFESRLEGVRLTFAVSLVVILCYTPQILLITWQFACSFEASKLQEFIVYSTEMLKSLAVPVVYWIFKGKSTASIVPLEEPKPV